MFTAEQAKQIAEKATLIKNGYKLEQRETRLADILLISWD